MQQVSKDFAFIHLLVVSEDLNFIIQDQSKIYNEIINFEIYFITLIEFFPKYLILSRLNYPNQLEYFL